MICNAYLSLERPPKKSLSTYRIETPQDDGTIYQSNDTVIILNQSHTLLLLILLRAWRGNQGKMYKKDANPIDELHIMHGTM